MKQIYKYPLGIEAHIILDGPIISPLTVQSQNGRPCLWAVVDDSLPSRSIEVHCVGTGIPFTSNMDNSCFTISLNIFNG